MSGDTGDCKPACAWRCINKVLVYRSCRATLAERRHSDKSSTICRLIDALDSGVHTQKWLRSRQRRLDVLTGVGWFELRHQLLSRPDDGHSRSTWRTDLERVGLLLGEQDTHRTHFLLDRSQCRDEGGKSKLGWGDWCGGMSARCTAT